MKKVKIQIKNKKDNRLTDFLFEASTLKRLKRTGWQVLGANEESIAEHTFMVCVISFLLADQLKADTQKTLITALFHDFEEARTGDVYKLADLYTKTDKKKAVARAFGNLPNSYQIMKLLDNYEKKNTLEAKIVHDADTLALCIELKQIVENGNANAVEWLTANVNSLKLPQARKLGKQILGGNSQDWWKKEREILHKRLKK